MTELDEKIFGLKREGASLRQISVAVGISHVAVLKRLRGLEASGRVVTAGQMGVLLEQTEEVKNMFPSSKSRRSTDPEEPQRGGNRVVTPKAPSHPHTTAVNPLKTLSLKAPEGKKDGNSSCCDDLVSEMFRFLESKGVEFYQMKVEAEAYQVTHNGQVIRFYIHRGR